MISKLAKIALTFSFVVITNIAFANTNAARALTQQLQTLKSFQASFSQKLFNSKGRLLQTTSGTFYLQKPNRFRWQVTYPTKQLYVADGAKLWFYDNGLQQVTVQNLKHALGSTPASLLSGDTASLTKRYQVSQVNGWFLLNARSGSNLFPVVQLQFEQGQLSQMKMRDNLGQLSQLQFNHIQMNIPLSPSLFKFTPPANADVIGNQQQ